MSSDAGDAPLVVIPDAGPLITLAYADSLDLLEAAGGEVWIVDMIEHEVTRNATPTSERIGHWIDARARVVGTALFESYRQRLSSGEAPPRKANLGELAAQEVMNSLARSASSRPAIFLFEDHRIARSGFVLPDGCSKISTRAWLRFLERTDRIDSAWTVERRAVENGRAFSRLRFPPDDRVNEPAADFRLGEGTIAVAPGREGSIPSSPTPPDSGEFPVNEPPVNEPNASRTARRGPNTVEILRLVVTLEDVEPRVSRTLLIRASSPLSTLHAAIQQAMPWRDCHLHEFEKDGVRYGPDWYRDEEPELAIESERKRLGTLFRGGSDTLRYLYDFGDSWRHAVKLDARLPPDLSLRRPRCIAGENACPPEDVGGAPGYERFLGIMGDPGDEEHADTKRWVGGDFDPTRFDLDAAEARLASWFPTVKRVAERA